MSAFPLDPPIEPMLAKLADAIPAGEGWLYEPKWDGFRAIVFRGTGDELYIQSRDLKPLDRYFPELHDVLSRALPEGCVVDGEIVIATPAGLDFDALQLRLHPAASRVARLAAETPSSFVAFDLLYQDRRPLLARPLVERRRRLLSLGLAGRHVGVPAHLEADGEPFLEVVAEYGLEGIVAKRKTSAYVPGVRTSDWLKCHVTPRADVVLGGLVQETSGTMRALCGMYADDGSALQMVGEAYVPAYLARWLDDATRSFADDTSPFATPLPLRPGMRWLRPKLVAIVEHAGEPGELRDARFRNLRLDGRLDDCRVEGPVEIESEPATAGTERPRLVLLQSLRLSFEDPHLAKE
jgi:ATP-dependent DNA ligase